MEVGQTVPLPQGRKDPLTGCLKAGFSPYPQSLALNDFRGSAGQRDVGGTLERGNCVQLHRHSWERGFLNFVSSISALL